MISYAKALQTILREVRSLSSEKVKLRKSLGRALTSEIRANESLPPFDNSAMDGFAIVAIDTKKATTKHQVTLKVVGESSAGNPYQQSMKRGDAVRIMTGAVIPDGANAVVPLESVTMTEKNSVVISSQVRVGSHIRKTDEDVAKGEMLIAAGTLLSPGKIGLLAALGHKKVEVVRKPRVNIIATGDELVPIGDTPKRGQIRNSNSYSLAALVEQAGGKPKKYGIVPDAKNKIAQAIRSGLKADILLITGGVSVGKYDLVRDVLTDLGVKIKFWKVNIKPGKPLLFGTYGKTLVFGLPGNPVSSGVTFLQFVRPAIFKMLGQNADRDHEMSAILDEQITKSDSKRHFVRGIASRRKGQLHVRTAGTQSSGAQSSMARANCLIVIPETSRGIKKGSKVNIQLFQTNS